MKLMKEAVIPASICDPNVKLALKGTFDLVQDYLTEMLGAYRLDGVSLRERFGCVWIFTRNKIVIDRELMWKERYTVESFISSAKGAKATVDTVLRNEDGEIAVYSRVEMCAIDLQTQKIQRVTAVGVVPDEMVIKPERELRFNKLMHDDLKEIDSVVVKSEDIDFIQHTNNVSYIRFLMNTYTVKELRERPVREIEVRYLGQTHEGDTLTIYKGEKDGKELFRIALGDMTAIECEIVR